MFYSIETLCQKFLSLGAHKIFCKQLAENDNSKQQIYLGGSFGVIQMFRFEQIEAFKGGKIDNFKARLSLFWVDGDGHLEQAHGAQLILYPQYPEVRLSGFLKGCKLAPSEHLRPTPKENRKFNNGPDGRVLFFGATKDGTTLITLAPANSTLAQEFEFRRQKNDFESDGIFFDIPLPSKNSRFILLEQLARIAAIDWHDSIRLNKHGEIVPYTAKNGGGYTLEALLGIIPNGRAEPDYNGWELKAYSSSRITLMTPEPNAGEYGSNGVENFVRRYGRPISDDTLYFTGQHRANVRNAQTQLTLAVRGFNAQKCIIEDVGGAIELLTENGDCAAAWTFESLIQGWNKKHAQAAYVKYLRNQEDSVRYQYLSPVHLGEGTDFTRFLAALASGSIIFDPGSKVMQASTPKSTVKARSQFRIPVKQLASLYKKFEAVEL